MESIMEVAVVCSFCRIQAIFVVATAPFAHQCPSTNADSTSPREAATFKVWTSKLRLPTEQYQTAVERSLGSLKQLVVGRINLNR